jgi:hypothetical protein
MLGCALFCALAVPMTRFAEGQGANAASELFEEPGYQGVCAEALADPLPADAAVMASRAASEQSADSSCKEQELYYGFGRPPEYGAALRCAYLHRAHAQTGTLDGAGTLAMLYANGDGVPQDYALAIRFACEVGNNGGSNEAERIGRLEALRDGKLPQGTRFDLCDEQMSGAMGAYCSEISERQSDGMRAKRVAAIAAVLPARAKAMLPALEAAEDRFEQARIKGEYPGGGGSGSVGFALDDQNRLREQFVLNLENFRAGKVPRATEASKRKAQEEMDAAFAATLGVPRDPNAPFGEPTTGGLKTTQAAWQELFGQWMRFVRVAFPGLEPEAVATELLRLRTHQLRKTNY